MPRKCILKVYLSEKTVRLPSGTTFLKIKERILRVIAPRCGKPSIEPTAIREPSAENWQCPINDVNGGGDTVNRLSIEAKVAKYAGPDLESLCYLCVDLDVP